MNRCRPPLHEPWISYIDPNPTRRALLKTLLSKSRGVHPSKSIMHIAYFPYFSNIYKFPPISVKFMNLFSIFVQFSFFNNLIDVFMMLHPILTMVHLCIMLYT